MTSKNIILGIVVVLIIGAIAALQIYGPAKPAGVSAPANVVQPPANIVTHTEKALKYALAAEIADPTGFINTKELKLADLVGKKVILLDFWTYSCINCQRTIPYLNAWYKKYKDLGLEIVGVHTPEFEFEKQYANVAAAVKQYGIEYPVVMDSNYGTWSAYQNQYWPHEFLIDIDGFIVHDHIGEGGYDETEKIIQELLAERAMVLKTNQSIDAGMANPSDAVAVDFSSVGSPETYFGAARNSFFGNGTPGETGTNSFKIPSSLKLNAFYLAGDWNITKEYAQSVSAAAGVSYSYQAKNVYVVASSAKPVKVKVMIDGKLTKELVIQGNQLYQLVNGDDYRSHVLELIISDPGVQLYALTFG